MRKPPITATDISIKPQQLPRCTLQLLCSRDLDFRPMTLKLYHDLDILKTYHHTRMKLLGKAGKYKNSSRSKIKVKCHQLPTTSGVHGGTYSYQVTLISDQ